MLPGKNVAFRLLDDPSIIRLVIEVMRFDRISLQVIESIQGVISQAEFPPFRRDYSTGRFIHCAFNSTAARELGPFHYLDPLGGPFHKNLFWWHRFALQ